MISGRLSPSRSFSSASERPKFASLETCTEVGARLQSALAVTPASEAPERHTMRPRPELKPGSPTITSSMPSPFQSGYVSMLVPARTLAPPECDASNV